MSALALLSTITNIAFLLERAAKAVCDNGAAVGRCARAKPDPARPACFIGGLVLAVGAGGDGQGLGNGSAVIESMTGSPVPEPSTWAMMAIGFVALGYAGWRGSRTAMTVGASSKRSV